MSERAALRMKHAVEEQGERGECDQNPEPGDHAARLHGVRIDGEPEHKSRGISLAELVRRGLEETMAREPANKPWMVYAGVIDGDEEDSSTVDEVVYGREAP